MTRIRGASGRLIFLSRIFRSRKGARATESPKERARPGKTAAPRKLISLPFRPLARQREGSEFRDERKWRRLREIM